MQSDTKPLPRGWLVVALLWFVGVLNYLDRNMITTMRESLVNDISMSEAQFGLLTSMFLWVYAAFSPVAGILSDRLSRNRVIIVSVFVWSAVTWMTGFATTYNELRIARALMGISEACFIPAALAMVADYHRGGTRSLANSLVLSGVSFGGAIGGAGGWLAQRATWSTPFKIFGVVGVVYALFLIFVLRDAPRVRPQVATTGPATKSSILDSLIGLFSTPAFIVLLLMWSLVGFSGWALTAWTPTFLQEKFKLEQGTAGFLATGSLQGVAFFGMIMGGAWGDRWSRATPRGRIFVSVVGLLVSGLGVFLAANSHTLTLVLAGLMTYGLTRVFADANLMPVLCQVSDPRYRATGYGILNAFSCTVGGLAAYAGGALRDNHNPLVYVYQVAAGVLILCAALMLVLRPPSSSLSDHSQPGAK